MRRMTSHGIITLCASLLFGDAALFFILSALSGTPTIGNLLDAVFFGFSVASCLLLAFCYKNAYVLTMFSGLGGTLLWGWQMFSNHQGMSLAVFYLIVLINSLLAVREQYGNTYR